MPFVVESKPRPAVGVDSQPRERVTTLVGPLGAGMAGLVIGVTFVVVVLDTSHDPAARSRASGVLVLAAAAALLVAAGLIVLAVWVVAFALLYGAARQVRQARTEHSMAGVTWRAVR